MQNAKNLKPTLLTNSQKKTDFVGYEENSVIWAFYSASVGSLSRRWIDDVRTLAASERSKKVARVRTI
jgi:hypothetical protein